MKPLTQGRSIDDFDNFCREAHVPLVGALSHIVGDHHVAEELAQEALVRAYLRWSRVSQLRSPLGWTVHVGTNLARTTLRRRTIERRARARVEQPGVPAIDDVPTALVVREALDTLSVSQREVIVLRYFLGFSAVETGGVLGIDSNAVRQRSHRALAVLREKLVLQGDLETQDG